MAQSPSRPPPAHAPQPPSPLFRGSFKAASIEDQIRLAYHTPEPGRYDPVQPRNITHGGFNHANVPSMLDAVAKTHEGLPSPGAYDTRNPHGLDLPEGGRLNRNEPYQSVLPADFGVPSPCHYDQTADPTRPRQLYGSFGLDPKYPKYIRDEELRAKEIPAPGSYDIEAASEAALPFLPQGGRIGAGPKPSSYFDAAAKLAEGKPDPGAYDPPGAFQVRPQGMSVLRHQSATVEESKALVEKMVNLTGSTPGPGTYHFPDPMSPDNIRGSPTLKGRKLPHSMPQPYQYNCAPDYGKKFIPFRQQNSGDQIYGRQGHARKHMLALQERELQGHDVNLDATLKTMSDPASEQGEYPAISTGASWAEGGFESIRTQGSPSRPPKQSPQRSRSTGMLPVSFSHPAVEMAAVSYPKLAGKQRKGTQMFMPMASRRCEVVGTKDYSLEYRKFHLSRDRLGQLSAGLRDAAGATVLQVDPEEMKNEAYKILEHKAKSQLRLEGVPYDKRRLIIQEMREMFESPTKSQGDLGDLSISSLDRSPQNEAGSASASASASTSALPQASGGAASVSAASGHLQSSAEPHPEPPSPGPEVSDFSP